MVQRARRSLQSGTLSYGLARRAVRALSRRGSVGTCATFLREAARLVAVNEHLCSFALNACARSGDMDECEALFREFVKQPTAVSYCILVKGYGRRAEDLHKDPEAVEECLDRIDELVREMNEAGIATDTVFVNALIDSYVRCGRIDLATATLHQWPPTAQGHNAVLKGLARSGDLIGSAQILRAMQELELVTAVTEATFVHCLAVAGKLRLAEKRLANNTRLLSDATAATAAFTAVVKGHARRRDSVRAFALLRAMAAAGVARNEVTYTELMLASTGDGRLVDAAWRSMKFDGIEPSSITYNAAIAAYLPEDVEAAFGLAKEAQAKGLMTAATLNTLLDALLKDPSRRSLALGLFARAVKLRGEDGFPRPTAASFSIVLRFFGRLGQLDKVRATWRAALSAVAIDAPAANTYLDALSRCGLFSEAVDLLEAMADRGEPCRPDAVSYATVVAALAKQPTFSSKALELFDQAKDRGFRPDAGFLRAALTACAGAKARQRALDMLAQDLDHLDDVDKDALKAYARSVVLDAISVGSNRPKDSFINNKNWNSFDSHFRLL